MTNFGIKKLGHVCLGTGRLDAIVDFYTGILGFKVIHRFVNDQGHCYGVFMLVNNGTFLEFFNDELVQANHGPFRHLCFEVDDIRQTAQALTAKGYPVEVRRGRTDGVLQCWIDDPDGNRIEFHEYDQHSVQYRHTSAQGHTQNS